MWNISVVLSAVSAGPVGCWQPREGDWQRSLHSRRGRKRSESFSSSSGSDKNSLSLPWFIWFWQGFQPCRVSRKWDLVFTQGAAVPCSSSTLYSIATFSHLRSWNQFWKLRSQKLLQNPASSAELGFLEISVTLWHLLSPFSTQTLVSWAALVQELCCYSEEAPAVTEGIQMLTLPFLFWKQMN